MVGFVPLWCCTGMRFNEYAAAGQWSGETAGGCRNFDTFANNPQFFFTVDDPDDPDDPDDDDKCSVLIGLMQKGRREQKHLGVEDLCIGFSVYKVRTDFGAVFYWQDILCW